MESLPIAEPTQDERTRAVLAHALQVGGSWIAPLIILIIRHQSKFVAFHALQALLLQVCYFVAWILFVVFWVGLMFTTLLSGATKAPQAAPPAAFFVIFPLVWLFAMGGGSLCWW